MTLASCLVDTNILLRATRRADPQHQVVSTSLARLASQGTVLHYTPQNIAELWNAMTRPAARNGLGLSAAEADREVRAIEDQRRQEVVHDLIRQAFLRGISTRQVSQVLQPVLGEDYSAQTISNILRPLTAEVAQFHRAPLADHFIYLFLDGVVLKVRDFAGQVCRRVVLVAYGVLPNGKRKIIAFQLTHAESENAWSEFLHDLFQRGLQGQHLKLIITDGGTGLRAALPLVYPRVPVQLCWAHKMRNIADKVGRREGSCVAQAAAIYLAHSRSQAQRAFIHWRQAWQHRRPRAVACVERDLEHLLHFFSAPEGHWKKVRTTNVIERAFREVRRRTRPISSFCNDDSCQRIIYGVVAHLNSSWGSKPLPEFTQTC
jgi:putative transposase